MVKQVPMDVLHNFWGLSKAQPLTTCADVSPRLLLIKTSTVV